MNFFKIQVSNTGQVDSPTELFFNYLQGGFVFDMIAVLPYSTFAPNYIFLRFIKLWYFNKYLTYFTDSIVEMFHSYMTSE